MNATVSERPTLPWARFSSLSIFGIRSVTAGANAERGHSCPQQCSNARPPPIRSPIPQRRLLRTGMSTLRPPSLTPYHLCPFILDHAECQRYFHIIAGEPTSRPAERDAKAESAS